jgi:HNH endonuclease
VSRALTLQEVDRAVALYEEIGVLRQVARVMMVREDVVSGALRDRGVLQLRGKARPLDEILVIGSRRLDGNFIKRRLFRAGLLTNKCAECGMGPEWNGSRLVLHLDHINGHGYDNRLENLRLLCPNCHSQTSTYCGRNQSREDK